MKDIGARRESKEEAEATAVKKALFQSDMRKKPAAYPRPSTMATTMVRWAGGPRGVADASREHWLPPAARGRRAPEDADPGVVALQAGPDGVLPGPFPRGPRRYI